MDLIAEIHEEDGMYWAQVEELPGCFASGESIPVLIEALEEAVSLYLAPAGESAPVATHVASVGLHIDRPAPLAS